MNNSDGQLIALKFGAGKSLRYHAARRSFFDILHRTALAIAAIGGSATFVALIGDRTLLATITAAFIAVTTVIDVVVGFSERARHHDGLYRRWSDLNAKIIRHGPPDEQVLRDWMAERALIEKEEPTPLTALNIICHNEESEAQDYGEETIRYVRWHQRLFRHLLTMPPNNFPTLKERKARDKNTSG